jgi:ubiquinone biosynthesis protein
MKGKSGSDHEGVKEVLTMNWLTVGRFLLFVIGLIVLGTVSSRLLGIRLSWRMRLFAALLGALLGGVFTGLVWYNNRGVNFVPVSVVSHLFFTMVIAVLMELLARPGRLITVESHLVGLPHPVRAVRKRISRTNRYAQITWIAVRHGFGGYLGGSKQGSESAPDVNPSPSRLAVSLRDALQEAGGLFVKMGQMLSTRRDLLPPDIIERLSDLQDQVLPAPGEEIEALLAEELKDSPHTVFAKFETHPLAAASMAQVHRAWLKTGEPVAVKVQRPHIRESVERDLDIMLKLAQTVELHTEWGKTFHAVGLATGFAESIQEELDFEVEARNTALIATFIQPGSSIRIPRVHTKLSSSRVLVLDWLDGVAMREAEKLVVDAGFDRQGLARNLLHFMLRQIMVDGVFHADPHPGNVMVLRDGRIALIDWGSIGRLDPLQQAALRNMLIAVYRRDASGLHTALLDIAERRAGGDEPDEERLERALAHFMARRLGSGMPMSLALFTDLFHLLLEFGMGFPPEIGAVFRAVTTLEGTLRILSPDFNMIEEARSYAATLVQETIQLSALSKMVEEEIMALAPILHRLPRRLDRISTSMERGSFSMNMRMFADERDQRFIATQVGRLSLALIGSLIGLMSVFLITSKGGPLLLPSFSLNEFLGYMGLFSSVTVMMRVVVAILRSS